MARFGLYRVPLYPQLKVLNDDPAFVKVLSVILFLATQDSNNVIKKERDVHLFALYLQEEAATVLKIIDDLILKGILKHQFKVFLRKKDPQLLKQGQKLKDEYASELYLTLDLRRLMLLLEKRGLNLPLKILKNAALDKVDFFGVISERTLPLMQKLVGQVSHEDFDKAALICAQIATYATAHEEDFSYKALAPGWRLLLQPAINSEESEQEVSFAVAQRWMREDERAIDLSFADGNFFMTDSSFIGGNQHYILHGKKQKESTNLAAACLIGMATVTEKLCYISDLSFNEVKEALEFLYKATGLKGRLTLAYFLNLQSDEKKAFEDYAQYQKFIGILAKT